MKKFEDFNKEFNQNKSAEIQAFEMIIGEIAERFNIEESELECYERKFKAQINWLNEEV